MKTACLKKYSYFSYNAIEAYSVLREIDLNSEMSRSTWEGDVCSTLDIDQYAMLSHVTVHLSFVCLDYNLRVSSVLN